MPNIIRKSIPVAAAFLTGTALTIMLGAGALSQPTDPTDGALPPGMDPAGMQRWMEFMTPGPQHAELAQDTGEWAVHSKFWTTPDAAPEESDFRSVVTSELGGRFLVEHLSGSVMGMPFEGIGITGYDNHTEKWVSVWMDNMSTSLYYSEGEEQADGRIVMYGDFYDPMNNTEGEQKIILDRSNDAGPTMTMQHQMDGKWKTSMVMTYSRHDNHGDDHGGDHGHHSR